MTRLQQLPASLQRSLEQRSALKVIAGLMNFDDASVERVARAEGRGGADQIDVACDPALGRRAIEAAGGVPVCVSSVEPEQFPAAVAAGAVMVEIVNYDAFYPQGRIFDAAEVLELTRRTRQLLPNVVLSVTVPHVLPMDAQEQLAIANAVSIVMTAMVPDIRALLVSTKHDDLERGSSLRRTVSAPASHVEPLSLDFDLSNSASALSALISEASAPDCVISSVGELGPGPEETRCWSAAQQYSATSSDG